MIDPPHQALLLFHTIHHVYAPDWIWLTVVGGNALIGGMFALWLGLDPLPAATYAAFWRLLALNVAAGVPIIAWQIGQANARPKLRQRRQEAQRGPDDPRRPDAP